MNKALVKAVVQLLNALTNLVGTLNEGLKQDLRGGK